VFVTEIERALQERRIDLAVHSLKDLPTAQPDGLRIVVPGPREDVRDVFISQRPFQLDERGLSPLDAADTTAVRMGTSSLRRTAQVRTLCPGADILPLRGNVDTRIGKLLADQYDGIILAAAGLHRLNSQQDLAAHLLYLPVETLLPAPGQGALGLEIRAEPEMRTLLAPLADREVQAAISAERMFMRRLGAGCYLPVAAHGSLVDEQLVLHGLVTSLDGQQQIRVCQRVAWTPASPIEQAEQLGTYVAEQALAEGAGEIIQAVNVTRGQVHQYVG
jgi:hydroxymethylbilane synthase